VAEKTVSSMHDAREAEDRRLLEAGDHAQLLANYFYPVQQYLVARLRSEEEANEVTQTAFDRLLRELSAGRAYAAPFRVVVWNVVGWKLKEHFRGRPEVPLPEERDPPAPDELERWEEQADLEALFADLPVRQREVATRRYLHGLEPPQIARKLDIEPNAVHQALHNAHKKLRERLPLA
jgi:RNA polymerase sigma factor (sigma-70 family)